MIRIKRVDRSLPLPEYKTKGAAAFDLYTREDVTIPAQGWGKAPSNIVIEIPQEHALLISARSSLAKNYPGLFLANGLGLIDSDYCGENDEILISMYNFTTNDITINKGERIAQAFLVKFRRDSWEEVVEMENKDRGGFGSTGLRD
ncbi:MAG: dUTP diphosphatase [Nanoarchaeota archaeon]|nr:dUTP diphosphatase [Nanoarchaeota archaeon]MBU1622693.1 dUTP diphosphatase [Nanoarchaeota archaeon]MBU1974036.1 dUTP diphosphatase [Nanoarchaeota archaeon]